MAHESQHSAPTNQQSALSNQHFARATQHLALSNQHSALSTQRLTLSSQHSAPATQHLAPFSQHSALSSQHFARPNQHMALARKHLTPTNQHSARPNQHLTTLTNTPLCLRAFVALIYRDTSISRVKLENWGQAERKERRLKSAGGQDLRRQAKNQSHIDNQFSTAGLDKLDVFQ